jgi:uncharacterized protein YecT (DUF1311 family)
MFRVIAVTMLSISTSALATCPAFPADVASECLVDATQKADKQLVLAYQKLIPEAAPNDPDEKGQATGKKLLADAHKSWLVFRKNQCAFEGFHYGGVGIYKSVAEYQCVLRLTIKKTTEYKQLAVS